MNPPFTDPRKRQETPFFLVSLHTGILQRGCRDLVACRTAQAAGGCAVVVPDSLPTNRTRKPALGGSALEVAIDHLRAPSQGVPRSQVIPSLEVCGVGAEKLLRKVVHRSLRTLPLTR